MSQEQPQQPEPKKQTPPTPTPKGQSGEALQKVTQTLQQTWSRVQPVLKTQSANALRGITNLVGGTGKKQEIKPPTSPQTPPTPEGTATPTKGTKTAGFQSAPPTQSFTAKLAVFLTNLPVWWKATLGKIRSRLPASVNEKLPNDTILSGAIAALFILLFWATSVLSPPNPPQIAEVPSPSAIAPTEVTAPPPIEAPAELSAPSEAQPVAIIPPPPPVLTPEQNLIAAIQNQVVEITSQYADGLIESIQANFIASILTVKVSNDWYSFDSAKQDSLAADMWNRAKQLDFSKLEIADFEGVLLARSPVVGSHMVILKRGLPIANQS
ncbi:hypothetical protein ACE1CD_00615 [Aerosakkonema sp. BLCC-F183]|uniref:hypothetical protein n=1 Tax=Aerosakkonema sp. BLCC-F183 TaxID=3342834 RepID=UPI0035B7675D